MTNKCTLITGGASGLGFELSKRFAQEGNNLLLISSNINNLEAAKDVIEREYKVNVDILQLDLSKNTNFGKVKEYTDSHNMFISNLVNCAGFGDRSDFKDMDPDKQVNMIELNCNAPLYLMTVYIKDMLKNNEGHILNISSIAGFYPGPYMVTYHASKAFLNNLSEGIHHELKGSSVHMTIICPGPFTSGFVSKAHNDYTFKKIKPIPASKVADISMKMFHKNKRMYVIGFGNRVSLFFSRFFPRNFVTNISATQIKEKD